MPSQTGEGVLAVLAERPRWMSLQRDGDELTTRGYTRAAVGNEDWTRGDIATKTFGPASETWIVDAVSLLTAVGEPIVTVSIPRVGVDVGQEFIFDMRIDVPA